MSQVDTTKTGKAYWRSLDDLADAPEIRERIEQEFVGYDPEQWSGLSRRQFLKLMGASMALAGLTLSGCRRWPEEKLAPYASRPADQIPGTPEYYASAMDVGGYARPVLVKTFDGRPIKLEGNPSHPMSGGSSDSFTQASVLNVYDPDRAKAVVHTAEGHSSESTWPEAIAALRGRLQGDGSGFAVLSGYSSSPSVARMKKQLQSQYPGLRWYEYEPVNFDAQRAGAAMVYGQPARPLYHLENADLIACFDADLLGLHPAHLAYAKGWAAGRKRANEDGRKMSRMYAVESAYTTTGAAADVRYNVRSCDIPRLLVALANELGVSGPGQVVAPEAEQSIVKKLAAELKAAAGRSVVAVGPQHPASVHALVMLINEELGNVGKTVSILPEQESAQRSSIQSITDLTQSMNNGRVQTLLVLGGNPAYDAPADLGFAEALAKVPATAHLTHVANETTELCGWLLPEAHYLEAWGDARAFDGTVSVVQPTIMPLFGGRSVIQVVANLLGEEEVDGLEIVKQTIAGGSGNEAAWQKALHDGLVEGSKPKPLNVAPSTTRQPENIDISVVSFDTFEVTFLPDASAYDGRFANNGWLQELPRTITKLTWDNAAMVSVPDAEKLGITTGDMISMSVDGRSIEVAAYVLPGQAPGSIAVYLGYGRTAAGQVGTGVGFNVYPLRASGRPHVVTGVTVSQTGESYELVCTQDHHMIDPIGFSGRADRLPAIYREADVEHYHEHPDFAKHFGPHVPMMESDEGKVLPLQLYDPPANFGKGHQWGMTIDLNACIGCNGCVVACQAENNIPVVGKEQVSMNREMHWLRIDRYFQGPVDAVNPRVVHQPVLCMHCETAPCEQVCPVAATVHDTEGLNTMVYNRCIGTRYCSNNCPYKVRRFNYFDYHAKGPNNDKMPWLSMPDTQQREQVGKVERMVFNPDVTVRMRGVMEKCTFCVQRIEAAKVNAKVEYMNGKRDAERVADGEVVTACQQSCPTDAIVFGDLNDPKSRVRKLHVHQRSYALLEELNTRPRTRYLANVNNPAHGAPGEHESAGHGEAHS